MFLNDPGCVKTLRGIIAPGILGSTVTRRVKKRKNLSSARHYDQIRFRFHTAKRPWLCENSTRYNRTRNFGLYGHAESKKTQKFVFRSALRPNQISFSHGQDPGCVKTLRGIIAPGILGSTVTRRVKKRKNLSSARHLVFTRPRPWLCENSTRYNRTRNFGLYGHAESKKTQKFVFRSALRPNQISFSHGQDRNPL